ncbi:MAG: asparagine synthase (glutamine-hydrolyzing) [Lentisphaeria bacterium]|nr:asparagine synthase (glutamine-hydrolyzing) [Lentisphaeria bacterium]
MCAISGIVNTHGEAVEAIVKKMMAAQAHRGPDDSGIFSCRDAVFGHNRLAVIDLKNGHQPMISENGRLAVILNGEIYNFKAIREKLTDLGHRFVTESDTETIIHLYEMYGSECVEHLDGMFALAVFDTAKKKLLLARDRLGQKPLFYFMNGDSLVFASEFSALMAHPACPKQLDKEALHNYLSLQYVPQPDTAFKQIRKLPPGHILEQHLENNQISIRCYWQADFSIKNSTLSFSAATAELRRLVEKAVEKRLVSDVPIGTFLSGGVDSCIVTGLTAKLMYPAPCDAFTAAFSNASYDERDNARRSAEIINSVTGGNLRHHVREVKPDDFGFVESLFAKFGEPFADISALPLCLLSKIAKEQVTVALCGDGADEIFAGYERYLAMRYAEKIYFLPQSLRKIMFNFLASFFPNHGERSKSGRIRRVLKLFADPEKTGYFNLLDRCPEQLKKELYGPAMQELAGCDSSECFTAMSWELIARDKVEKLAELDLRTYLPCDILPKADIASMSNALELRSPFLDKAVVEFASRLPMQYKLNSKQRKYILCAAFPEFITPEVLNRPKRGFGVPISAWLRESWKNQAHDKLFNSRLVIDGFIRPEALNKYWTLHQNGYDFGYLLWDMLILAMFLDRNPDAN